MTGDRMSSYLEGGISTAFQLNYSPRGPRNRLLLGLGPTTTTFYRVDPVLRLDTLTLDHAGTGSDEALTFAYNPASQIVSRTGTAIAYAWTRARTADRAYAANGLNQYESAGEASFGYDANGNLSSAATVTEGSTSYVYDAENLDGGGR